MNLKSRIIHRIKELWEQKVFRYALILHSFYFILSIIFFFAFYQKKNDFIIFYNVGKIFLNDIENLYNQTYYLWDFRYLPLSALFFIPFSSLNFQVAFIIFNICNLFLNFLICIVLFKIILLIRNEDHENDDKRVILYISIYLMGLPHVLNYIYGQINLYITLLMLLSLYIFLKYKDLKWQLIGSIILGISIIIKPTAFFLIPFLIIFNINLENKRVTFNFFKSAIRIIGVIIPVLFNFILFLLIPVIWEGFLNTNFTGNNPIALNFSFSITKIIINFCYFYNIPFNQISILLGVISIVGGLGFLIFIINRLEKDSIIFGYAFGVLIMLLTYFDSWDHHLLNLTPILILVIFNLPHKSEITGSIKLSLFFFSFFDLAFIGIWYLIYPLFPYNIVPTFFLLLSFYGISKYCLQKHNEKKRNGVEID
ncbi:MAG: glycosyltransferase family 87 protein [Candidatus Odinarchaeota archaeon]